MPDFKTIANFRKDKSARLSALHGGSSSLLRVSLTYSHRRLSRWMGKFKAVNNRDRNFTSAKVQGDCMEQIEASINRYMSALDIADQQEAATEGTGRRMGRRRSRL